MSKQLNKESQAKTLFISDLHLHPSRPSITANFFRFLKTEAKKAEALYILGDFFEVWAGDDDPNPHHQEVIKALAEFSKTKIPLYFMRGNRDFLVDKHFAKASGCTLIKDPTVIELYGQKVLLMHGDSLCTGDKSHQRFRKISQQPLLRRLFLLLLPFSLRHRIATGIRKKSQLAGAEREKITLLAEKQAEQAKNSSQAEPAKNIAHTEHSDLTHTTINPYDVDQKAVEQALLQFKTHCLIHGHTHKPGIHEFNLAGNKAKRIVLGEWGVNAAILACGRDSFELINI